MTNTQAHIHFTPSAIDPVIDELSSRLDGQGFPVVVADLETGKITVDSSFDPDEYSVLMAASLAAEAVGIAEDDLLGVN